MQSYYNIIDYTPNVIYSISVAYLFYNWKLVPLQFSSVQSLSHV